MGQTPSLSARLQAIAEPNTVVFSEDTRKLIFVELGGLMSFGPDIRGAWRDCARVVSEILNGANPANIPISQPTKYEA